MTDDGVFHDPQIDVRAFRDALPGRARAQLHNTGRLLVLIGNAVQRQGWTVEQLVEYVCRDWRGAANVGGLIMFRLEHCADNPPAAPAAAPRLPFCDRVQNGATCEERRGWLEDKDGRPVDRCPCRTPNPGVPTA